METSFGLAYFPELVGRNADGTLIADDGTVATTRFEAVNNGWVSITRPWHLLTTNSGSGYPHAATAEKGRRMMDLVVERLAPFLVELSQRKARREVSVLIRALPRLRPSPSMAEGRVAVRLASFRLTSLRPARFADHFVAAVQPAVLAQARHGNRRGGHDHQRADAADDHGEDRRGEPRQRARLEFAQLVRGADEHAADRRDAPAHAVGREHLHQRVPHDDADAIERPGR